MKVTSIVAGSLVVCSFCCSFASEKESSKGRELIGTSQGVMDILEVVPDYCPFSNNQEELRCSKGMEFISTSKGIMDVLDSAGLPTD